MTAAAFLRLPASDRAGIVRSLNARGRLDLALSCAASLPAHSPYSDYMHWLRYFAALGTRKVVQGRMF